MLRGGPGGGFGGPGGGFRRFLGSSESGGKATTETTEKKTTETTPGPPKPLPAPTQSKTVWLVVSGLV